MVWVHAVSRSLAELAASYGLMLLDFALLRLSLEREEWTKTQLADALPVNPSRVNRRVMLARRIYSYRRHGPVLSMFQVWSGR